MVDPEYWDNVKFNAADPTRYLMDQDDGASAPGSALDEDERNTYWEPLRDADDDRSLVRPSSPLEGEMRSGARPEPKPPDLDAPESVLADPDTIPVPTDAEIEKEKQNIWKYHRALVSKEFHDRNDKMRREIKTKAARSVDDLLEEHELQDAINKEVERRAGREFRGYLSKHDVQYRGVCKSVRTLDDGTVAVEIPQFYIEQWCHVVNRYAASVQSICAENKATNEEHEKKGVSERLPTTAKGVFAHKDYEKIIAAVGKELRSLLEHALVPVDRKDLPPGTELLRSFLLNSRKSTGEYKSRIVVNGAEESQPDFDLYSPVALGTSYRMLLAMGAAMENKEMRVIDFKTAFLQADSLRPNKLAMLPPPGVVEMANAAGIHFDQDQRDLCFLIMRSVYGSGSSPLGWQLELDAGMKSLGWTPSDWDSMAYHLIDSSSRNVGTMAYHVDDGCLVCDHGLADQLLDQLRGRYQLTVKDESIGRLLGVDVARDTSTGNIELNQAAYIRAKVEEFQLPLNLLKSRKPGEVRETRDTDVMCDKEEHQRFRRILGVLLWIARNTCPQVLFHVGQLSRKASAPTLHDLESAERTLGYCHHHSGDGLKFERKHMSRLVREDLHPLSILVDASNGAPSSDRTKSVGGHAVYCFGGLIYAESRTFPLAERSSGGSELTAMMNAASHAVMLRGFVTEMELPGCYNPVNVFSDSQTALKNLNRRQITTLSRHQGFKITLLNDLRELGIIVGRFIPGDLNIADVLTKFLDRFKLKRFADLMLTPGHAIVCLIEEGVAGISSASDAVRVANLMGIDIGKTQKKTGSLEPEQNT